MKESEYINFLLNKNIEVSNIFVNCIESVMRDFKKELTEKEIKENIYTFCGNIKYKLDDVYRVLERKD